MRSLGWVRAPLLSSGTILATLAIEGYSIQMRIRMALFLSAACASLVFAQSPAVADVPRKSADAPAPETNADAFAEYTVGVFLLESGSAQAAIPHLEAAWEMSDRDKTIGAKLAEAYFSTGDLTKSDGVADALIAADPNDPSALIVKAKIAYLRSRKEEARGYLERIVAGGVGTFDVHRLLATVYTDLGMSEKAIESYARALEIERGYPPMFYHYAVLLRDAGREAEAERAFADALALKPDFSEAALALASMMADRGAHADAESVLVKLLEVDPENYPAIEMTAEIYIGRGQLDQAIRLLESENRKSSLPPEGQLLLGRLYYEAKDFEEALSIFEAMFESGNATPDLARVLGEISSKGGNTGKSLEYYRKAIELGPNDYRNHLALFFCASPTFTRETSQRIELPPEESAELLGRAASTVPPGDFDGLYLLGISYQSIDSLDTAREYLSRASEIRPDDERVILNLASVLEKLKRYDEAEKHLKALHAKHPDDPTTCNFYGYLLALMGKDLDFAEKLVAKALENEPQNGYYIDSLGWVYFMRGSYERAVEELERASRIVQDDPVILEHLGDAYSALNRHRDALGAYEKSRSIQKGNPGLDRKIDESRKKSRD
jgi:tetratricopeptide (TPR) repeat protein